MIHYVIRYRFCQLRFQKDFLLSTVRSSSSSLTSLQDGSISASTRCYSHPGDHLHSVDLLFNTKQSVEGPIQLVSWWYHHSITVILFFSKNYNLGRETQATVLLMAQSESNVNGKQERCSAVYYRFSLKISSFLVSLPNADRFGQSEILLLSIGIPLAMLWFAMGIVMVRSMRTESIWHSSSCSSPCSRTVYPSVHSIFFQFFNLSI